MATLLAGIIFITFLPVILIFALIIVMIRGMVAKRNECGCTVNAEHKAEEKCIGLVEVEKQRQYLLVDNYLRDKYRERLIKWEAVEDVTLHWEGKHTIKLYLINGDYKEIVIDITGTGDVKFKTISSASNQENETVNEPNLTDEKPELTAAEWVEKNIAKINEALKENAQFILANDDLPSKTLLPEVSALLGRTGDYASVGIQPEGLLIVRG